MDDSSEILNSFFSSDREINLQRPYRVMDVANYVVERFAEQEHPITNLLLLKMLYYLQAYSLVNNGERLFRENIEKWGYGPVEPIVYSYFKSNGAAPILHSVEYAVINGDYLEIINPTGRNLERTDSSVINDITEKLYRKYHENPFDLVNITHEEPMWKKDEKKIVDGVHNLQYSDEEIVDYFGSRDKWPW